MTNRIEWIDRLKGFAIFLVVYYHVVWAGFDYKDSVSCKIITTFFMHIFFFISGYLGCINNNEKSQTFPSYIYKKIRTLLIPTIMIICVGFLYINFTFKNIISDSFKGGFWFTLCLFEMLLLHYWVQLFLNKFRKESYKLIIGCIVSLILYFLAFHITTWMPWSIFISLKQVLFYYPAMMLGYFIKKDIFRINYFLNNKYIITFLIILSLSPSLELKRHGIQLLYNLIISLVRVLLIYKCFSSFKIKETNIINRSINYIGKYSLEIYFLHYFLFISIPEATNYITTNVKYINKQTEFISLFFREFIIAFPITITIIFMSIALNKLLSMSSVIQSLIFGKYKK